MSNRQKDQENLFRNVSHHQNLWSILGMATSLRGEIRHGWFLYYRK